MRLICEPRKWSDSRGMARLQSEVLSAVDTHWFGGCGRCYDSRPHRRRWTGRWWPGNGQRSAVRVAVGLRCQRSGADTLVAKESQSRHLGYYSENYPGNPTAPFLEPSGQVWWPVFCHPRLPTRPWSCSRAPTLLKPSTNRPQAANSTLLDRCCWSRFLRPDEDSWVSDPRTEFERLMKTWMVVKVKTLRMIFGCRLICSNVLRAVKSDYWKFFLDYWFDLINHLNENFHPFVKQLNQ